MGERGQFVQDYTEVWTTATAKRYIVYAAQIAPDGRHDPHGEYHITRLTLIPDPGTDTGTIQFFKEHVETGVTTALSNVIPVGEAKSYTDLPVEWHPGPLHDVYFTTTGASCAGFVSLRTHRVSNSFCPSLEIIP